MEELKEQYVKDLLTHTAPIARRLEQYEYTGNLICDRCGVRNARKNRQRTSYPDDKSNWAKLCPSCQEEADEYWDGMWKEYYSSVL